MSLLINWLIIIVVGFIAAIFVAAEFSVLKVRPSYLKELINNGNRTAKVAQGLLEKLNDTLSTTQVAITFTGILMGAIGESTLSETIVLLFAQFGVKLPENWILSTVSIIILTYLEVVLTELVPKSMAIDRPNKIVLLITRPVSGFQKIAFPLVWFMNLSAAAVLKVLGYTVATESEDIFTQAEILGITREAVRGGTIDSADATFISRGFDFNDRTAKDVMIDRTSAIFISNQDDVATAYQRYLETGLTRFPVMRNQNHDQVCGYLYAYDLAKQNAIDATVSVQTLIRPIAHVPEGMLINEIYRMMVRTKSPFALVTDEYGGTAGIITDEDINEELLGDIQDENDRDKDYVQAQDDGSYRVNGKITLSDFEVAFKVRIPALEESNAVTLSGYLLEQQPTIGLHEQLIVPPFSLTVAEIGDNQHITWITVSKATEKED
ncbi:hemolysin family protein [Loigolactobacillus zhaoyuanensis]|uniref:Hemolysin family protein n=1 Tax=Loigolactobacillus zhaoyuanensis TaxID=2486017 RepID=A0ABW8UES4_9LACO|nr:hemolysin family protein [Loigolactobacillus zhaoyuanensis]